MSEISQIQGALQVINQMQSDGVIGKYAIGGAVGATFYVEVATTYDIDVFITIDPPPGKLIATIDPLYEYLRERDYRPSNEFIIIKGWQVQFLPVPDKLYGEALDQALDTEIGGVKTRVMSAEHLMAIALQTGRGKDFVRLQQFVREGAFDDARLFEILERFKLTDKWITFVEKFINTD